MEHYNALIPILKSDLLIYLGIAVIIGLVIGVLWFAIYKVYMHYVTKDYADHIFDVRKVNLTSSYRDQMLRVYFNRQQTYELSAYIILGLAIIILTVCVLIFLFANRFLVDSQYLLTKEQFFLSGLSIRTGVAVLIIFITRVLLRLYRYCLKIANIHLARFDAILFHEHLNLGYKEAVETFSIHTDVGDSPVSPTKEAIDLFARVQESAKKVRIS